MSESSLIVKDDHPLDKAPRRTSDSNFDRIYNFYYYPKKNAQLTEKQEELRQRWEHMWKLLGGILTDRQAINKHLKEYEGVITESTAWKDLQKAKMLFGDPSNAAKDAKRAMVSDWLIKMMKKAYKADDFDGFSKLSTRYSKINGLENHNESNMEDLVKRFQPIQVVFTANPDELQKMAEKLMDDVTIETDHTELDDED